MGEVRLRVNFQDARLRDWASRNPERVHRLRRAFLLRAGAAGVAEMRKVARERFGRIGVRYPGLGPPTGFLAASIRASAPEPTHIDVAPNVPYAAAVDTGSKPHVILPKRARPLRWQHRIVFAGKKSKANVRFAWRVHHPGFRGHHYVARTAIRLDPILQALLDGMIAKEVTRP